MSEQKIFDQWILFATKEENPLEAVCYEKALIPTIPREDTMEIEEHIDQLKSNEKSSAGSMNKYLTY
jgi:hypothetical protein